MQFRVVDDLWRRVDSREPQAPTLAETLKELEIVIDDSCQFCRIIRYYEDYHETIVYRAYNMSKVTINIYKDEYTK